MTRSEAVITVRQISEQVCAIDISGDLTGFAEDDLMEAYARSVELDANTIVLNFEKLGFLNSSGIGLLITLLIRAKRTEQRLMAVGLNEHFTQIFELTNLNEAIHLYPNENEALAVLAQE